MIKQVVDISEASYIHIKNHQLVIDKNGETVGQVPVEDLGVLILQHPAIVITQAVIIACQKAKVVIVFCDENALMHSDRVKSQLPDDGEVRIIKITDKQFGKIEVFYGKKRKNIEKTPLQLQFF